jgi:hypothetical protein
MPCRKKLKPRPNYAFVTVGFEAKEPSWFLKHSGAARSHAAYWGGSAKNRRKGNRYIASPDANQDSGSYHDSNPAFGSFSDSTIRQRMSLSISHSLCYNQYDNLQHLPRVPPEFQAIGFHSAANFEIFKFCGEDFVRNFFMLDHEDYSIMFGGCMLLSYAHSMAVTGQGSKMVLLRLKGQVIRRISARVSSSDGLLSPWCLTAIMALAAPVVCLVSQDMPKNLTVWEYLHASMKDDFNCCCPEYAEIAQIALEERIVHREAMCRLLINSRANLQEAESLAFLHYISNSVNMYVHSNMPEFCLSLTAKLDQWPLRLPIT